jgi:hypothetical protein
MNASACADLAAIIAAACEAEPEGVKGQMLSSAWSSGGQPSVAAPSAAALPAVELVENLDLIDEHKSGEGLNAAASCPPASCSAAEAVRCCTLTNRGAALNTPCSCC